MAVVGHYFTGRYVVVVEGQPRRNLTWLSADSCECEIYPTAFSCLPSYSVLLLLCVGVWMLASRTISMSQARVGQDFFCWYCKALKILRVHTTINHHLFIHYYKFIKLFGPIYAWWLFGFEQFNGMLEKVVEWNLL